MPVWMGVGVAIPLVGEAVATVPVPYVCVIPPESPTVPFVTFAIAGIQAPPGGLVICQWLCYASMQGYIPNADILVGLQVITSANNSGIPRKQLDCAYIAACNVELTCQRRASAVVLSDLLKVARGWKADGRRDVAVTVSRSEDDGAGWHIVL